MPKILLLTISLLLLVCCGDAEGTFKITYVEAHTYSDSVLRSYGRPLYLFAGRVLDPGGDRGIRAQDLPDLMPQADLGGNPTAGIWVEWDADPAADGYAVYSGTRGSGLVLLTNLPAAANLFYIPISDPVFDDDYGVRIEATKTGYYPKASDAVWVPLLGQYTLSLVAPADYTNITTLNPAFQWSADSINGSDGRLDFFRIRQASGSFELVLTQPFRDMTSYAYNNMLLSRNTLYEWDIYKSMTYKLHNDKGTVVSVSFPRKPNADGETGSNNGRWYFMITE